MHDYRYVARIFKVLSLRNNNLKFREICQNFHEICKKNYIKIFYPASLARTPPELATFSSNKTS